MSSRTATDVIAIIQRNPFSKNQKRKRKSHYSRVVMIFLHSHRNIEQVTIPMFNKEVQAFFIYEIAKVIAGKPVTSW